MKTCRAGNHAPGYYCFMFTEQQKFPKGTQVHHSPQGYLEPSYGYGVVVKHVPSGHLIVLFDSGERELVSPFALTNNTR